MSALHPSVEGGKPNSSLGLPPPLPMPIGAKPKKRSLRLVAFCSVAFSTVSVLACIVTLPIVYNHVQSVQSYMQNEVDFCKTRSRDMWREMVQVQAATGLPVVGAQGKQNRTRRQVAAGYGAESVGSPPGTAGNPTGGSCCTCQSGAPGPPGPPGRDGRPG